MPSVATMASFERTAQWEKTVSEANCQSPIYGEDVL